MTNIVERLRNYAIPTDEDYSVHPSVCLEAADEIEQLRGAIIRGPCTQHSIPCGWPCNSRILCWKQIALGSVCEAPETSNLAHKK